ncbi:YjjG family noncanonical pyrimidine nucleotidase [Bacillus solimangrovi]|uniref:Noncanonical pyrimidine nucleotidase, YjjG family n=1 Tax=Bacillus solimangrovi TaxID=1305675 RepID=A0A1E5LHR3_9BACI|nr:YjjG family noncanonical pyrimidine nucleotidase [Bacillus solimangrovi]OEH93620.1 noncanonical pyrimidine nucleotidase, YjjG family [Bacillus solimangrovi]
MKDYNTLLFDVDDTLLDFGAAERVALTRLFEKQNVQLTTEIEERYKTINKGLWQAYELGELERDEVVTSRFSILFKEYGQEVDGELLEKDFRSYLDEGNQLVNGAVELVSELHKHYDLYIVTNGYSSTQHKRLHATGLHPLFKDVFVSEDTGFQKPMKGFFNYVFERITNFSLEKTIIIGDSLTADIRGGQIAGIDTCWFNPSMKQNETKIMPTFQIQKHEELFHILNGKKSSVGSY